MSMIYTIYYYYNVNLIIYGRLSIHNYRINKIIQMDYIKDDNVEYTQMMTVKEYNEMFQKQIMNQDTNILDDDDDYNEMDHN